MTLALQGIRVVDVTSNVSGPFATQILGDLGADVIKVERINTGDDTRTWGKPFRAETGDSIAYASLNRNKRSIALDLKLESDRCILDGLLETADVLVQNLRPGAFERLGYRWIDLHRQYPRLVYCEIGGFGEDGPMSRLPAFDPLMQAYSGLMSVTGGSGQEPSRIPVSILDKGTGMWAVIAIQNALRLRDASGKGARVYTSLFETAVMWASTQILGYLSTGEIPKRMGSGIPGVAPYQAYATRDSHILIAAGNDRLWRKVCEALGRPDLADDERFASNLDRISRRDELNTLIAQALSEHSSACWLRRFSEAGVPASLVRTFDEITADPHLAAVGMIEPPPPNADEQPQIHVPIRTNGGRFPIRRLPPSLDEHRLEILAGIGAQPKEDISTETYGGG